MVNRLYLPIVKYNFHYFVKQHKTESEMQDCNGYKQNIETLCLKQLATVTDIAYSMSSCQHVADKVWSADR